MTENCQAMMGNKQKMQAYIEAQDKELAGLIAGVNKAPDDKKVGLLAGVITKMAEQPIAMNERTAKMQEEMMQHMQMGKESMAQCPMMKGMAGKSADTHKGHSQKQK